MYDPFQFAKKMRPIRVLAITGKGGIGKTNISINLGAALAARGKAVYLFDADFGLANVDVLLGMKPKYTIAHFMQQDCLLEEVVLVGPFGLRIIPGFCGLNKFHFQPKDYGALIHSFNALIGKMDTLIIDTASGISDSLLRMATSAQEILVIINEDPSSISDAATIIEIMNQNYCIQRFRIVVNMSSSFYEAKKIFAKLANVTERNVNVVLHFIGCIPEDELVREAIKQQVAVVELFPSCQASQSFKQLAENIDRLALPRVGSGQVQFFIEQLINPQIVVQ
ncbi:MAG: P-loop NTPase [Proteobacteria bacterium]|nr:P-loop NTPase [Pseudomonadota bacterium]